MFEDELIESPRDPILQLIRAIKNIKNSIILNDIIDRSISQKKKINNLIAKRPPPELPLNYKLQMLKNKILLHRDPPKRSF